MIDLVLLLLLLLLLVLLLRTSPIQSVLEDSISMETTL